MLSPTKKEKGDCFHDSNINNDKARFLPLVGDEISFFYSVAFTAICVSNSADVLFDILLTAVSET